MHDLTCPNCDYTPGEFPQDAKPVLEEHDYVAEFVVAPFGPEKAGSVVICPFCGTVVSRELPENDIWIREGSDVLETSAFIPPYLRPQEQEPRVCEICEGVIQSDDESYIEPRDDGPFFLCSKQCYNEWHNDYYGSEGEQV